ncbi:MAG: PilN domain-containing protein [Stellaceae bacterium]
MNPAAEAAHGSDKIERNVISSILAWWLGQLADLLPARLRRSAATSDALVIAPIGPLDHAGAITVALRRNGEVAQLGEFALHAAELSDLPRSSNWPAVLRLTRTDVLEKTLILPLAAQADLNQVLAFEMGLETPFEPEDLYWNHRVETVDRQHGRLVVRLMLLPKATLGPLLSTLAQVGILPRWVEVSEGREVWPVLPLDGEGARPQHRSRRLFWPAAVCCGLLAFGVIATPFVRQAAELAALDRQVAAGRSAAAQAQRLRDEIDQLSGSAELVKRELGKAGRPLEVLASVTRVLPDDTYLTEIGLRQRKLTLSGRSAGAARLIGALAADGFRNPTFAAPVTRLEALHAEVFSIIAEVAPSP